MEALVIISRNSRRECLVSNMRELQEEVGEEVSMEEVVVTIEAREEVEVGVMGEVLVEVRDMRYLSFYLLTLSHRQSFHG
jgi:hypothetical protein